MKIIFTKKQLKEIKDRVDFSIIRALDNFASSCICEAELIDPTIQPSEPWPRSKIKVGPYGYNCKECGGWNCFSEEVTMYRCCECDVMNNTVLDDWQPLKIDDLPDLSQEYEWQFFDNEFPSEWTNCELSKDAVVDRIKRLVLGSETFTHRYRKRQPEKKEQTPREKAIECLAISCSISCDKAESLLDSVIAEYGTEKKEPDYEDLLKKNEERIEYLLSIISAYECMMEDSHKQQSQMIKDFKLLRSAKEPEA